jgi:predicted membrane channel-forming protein YqfA (hemolysin III family)
MASTVKGYGGRCILSGYATLSPIHGIADHKYQITIITLACATFCTNPKFRTPKWRKVRALLFCSIGWSGAIPMTHAVQKWGRAKVDAQMGWNLLFLEGLLYITGAIIYAVTTIYAVSSMQDR